MNLYLGFKLNEVMTDLVKQVIMSNCVELPPLVPVPLDRIHVTTLFLGNVDVATGKDILVKSCQEARSFAVHVSGAGDFGGKTLYLKVKPYDNQLVEIRTRQYNEFFRQTGRKAWPPAYIPHVTLAKAEGRDMAVDQIRECLSRLSGLDLGLSQVTAMGLYCKSELLAEVGLR